MRKLIYLLAALFLMSLPAQAGWNIKQNEDGSAVWIDGDSIEVPIGDSGIVVFMTDVGQAATSYVVSHKKGTIKKVYAVTGPLNRPSDGSSGDSAASITLGISAGSNGYFTPISAGSTLTLLTTPVGAATSIEPNTTVLLNNEPFLVEQGYVISIESDGTGNEGNAATITIVIE